MRILADENFPGEAVEALRGRGHDVAWVRTDSPGARDEEVLERATRESRLLVTFDKDFGKLAFRSGLAASLGVILFRVALASPAHVAQVTTAAIESRDDWANHFSVIEEGRIRMTPLPSAPSARSEQSR